MIRTRVEVCDPFPTDAYDAFIVVRDRRTGVRINDALQVQDGFDQAKERAKAADWERYQTRLDDVIALAIKDRLRRDRFRRLPYIGGLFNAFLPPERH